MVESTYGLNRHNRALDSIFGAWFDLFEERYGPNTTARFKAKQLRESLERVALLRGPEYTELFEELRSSQNHSATTDQILEEHLYKCGEFTAYPTERRVTSAHGVDITLTDRENKLFLFLGANIGRIVTNQRIANVVWGCDYDAISSIKTHAHRIRRKLAHPGQDSHIHNLSGTGYKLISCDIPKR